MTKTAVPHPTFALICDAVMMALSVPVLQLKPRDTSPNPRAHPAFS